MKNEFNYYFNGARHTSVDADFLKELTKNCEDPKSVIDGILESKARFDDGSNGD